MLFLASVISGKAIDYYELRLEITKEVGDKTGEVEAYGNLKQAKEYYVQRLSIAKELSNKIDEGRPCGDLANAYQSLEDFEKARHDYDQGLFIDKDLGHITGKRLAYGNPGIAYQNLGCLKQAIEYHREDRAGEQQLLLYGESL